MIAIKRASVQRKLHTCPYPQRFIQPSRLRRPLPHAEDEEGHDEGEYGEAIEDGDDEVVAWEDVYGAVVVDEANSIVFFIEDDRLVVEEEVSQYHKVYAGLSQQIDSQHTLLVVVAA